MVNPKDKEKKYIIPEFKSTHVAEDAVTTRLAQRTTRRMIARRAQFKLLNEDDSALAFARLWAPPINVNLPADGAPHGDALYHCLGCKISHLRKEKGWLQKDLAKETGISVSYISKLERGYQIEGVTLDILITLANMLDVSIKELFDFSKEEITLAYYHLELQNYS